MEVEVSKIIALAFTTEATTEYLFSEIPVFEKHIKKLAMVVGILIAILFKADVFALMGISSTSAIAGQVLTGIMISRGSNLVNTLLETAKNRAKPNAS